MEPLRITVLGGGAAGFFAALISKTSYPEAHVEILEKTSQLLSKVRISGGGRCNVTHACFEPKELIQNYPRGNKELLGPFCRFQPKDMMEWLESRGVSLKCEEDGRIFPKSNSSDEIINCFLREAKKLGVSIQTQVNVSSITKMAGGFLLKHDGSSIQTNRLILATGSSRMGHQWAKELGHTLQSPVPSLFTFNVPHFPLSDLAGISVPHARVHLLERKLAQTGSLLITHWGFSGPAALKLSAWEARWLAEVGYKSEMSISWTGQSFKEIKKKLLQSKENRPAQFLQNYVDFGIPKNLWKRLLERSKIIYDQPLGRIRNEELSCLAKVLTEDIYPIDGKTTHKAEFVTCGGVTLSEIHFSTMESRCCPGLFLTGEILDIDGITGGFNFQNAWTTGYLVGSHVGYGFYL